MCRLVAYHGPKTSLERLVVEPEHSLLVQSQEAHEAKLAVNGDGFGIAWYDTLAEPGIFKDVFPAWSDSNLPSICRMVRSHLFLAHVRASTEGETSRTNCHPFINGVWSFMHNGGIGDFQLIRRELEALLNEKDYLAKRGSTDSELFFLLMVTNGLSENPSRSISKTIEQCLELMRAKRPKHRPLRLTIVFSDGQTLYGFRYASDGKCPTLYMSQGKAFAGTVIASEPLDGVPENWQLIAPNQLVSISINHVHEEQIKLLDLVAA